MNKSSLNFDELIARKKSLFKLVYSPQLEKELPSKSCFMNEWKKVKKEWVFLASSFEILFLNFYQFVDQEIWWR